MTEMEQRIADLSAVADDPRKHLRYYRNSLADGERMDIPARIVHEKGCLVPATRGLSEETVRKLFADIPAEDSYRNVLYCPLSLRLAARQGFMSGQAPIYPYWIPSVVDRSGALSPPEKDTDLPWLIRGVLAPNEYLSSEYPVLSSVERVDELGMTVHIPRDSWGSYLTGAMRYFEDQVGSDARDLRVDGWDLSFENIVLMPADLAGMAAPLVQFYDQYLQSAESRLPGALHGLLTPRRSAPETVDDPVAAVLRSAHYGQMTSKFPLSPSQRVALALLDKTEPNRVLAVNGPPGTGKTTLVQGVVADLVVKAFLSGGKPPVIVGSSANNQAITNILDGFASVSPSQADRQGLNERWLPELRGLGHYLAANNADKLEKARDSGYWVSTTDLNTTDAYAAYCDAYPKAACESYFLGKLRAQPGVDDAVDMGGCETTIRDTVALLRATVDRVTGDLRAVRAFVSACGLGDAKLRALGAEVDARRETLREKRTLLDALIQREHLSPQRPGLLLRLIEWFRFGNPDMRRARVQAALANRPDIAIDLESRDLYALSAEIWDRRGSAFRDELRLADDWNAARPAYENLRRYADTLDRDFACGQPELVEAVQGLLDTRERHAVFWWALHGFECRWLLARDDGAYRALNQGQAQSLERWELRSYLTPVFVSTFHSLPNFFSFKKKTPQDGWLQIPLAESIDLLVVDEAGQVTPELGVPAFGLARRALVVGDARQLEPIWNIPSGPVDFSNGKRAGIVSAREAYEGFVRSGRSSVGGNLIALAQDASAFLYPPGWDEAGSLLVEHRRCVPEIIEFCNRFVYRSLLDVKTSSKESDWPALGYCHIGGESRKQHGSRSNSVEARAIAAWIKENRDSLTRTYSAGLADCVAIVTPFRGQRDAVVEALKSAEAYDKGMVIGTVHSLQGAEKPVVIFSPVYGRNNQNEALFFNQSYNMLNVAVSRAKHHFLVFGNMNLFSASAEKSPAGDLGKLLFRNPENEIVNDFLFSGENIDYFEQEPIDRISDLQKHRLSLRKAIETAEKRLVIVSPFISDAALRADGIPELLSAAVARGVEVVVVTDASLDLDRGSLKPHAESGRRALLDSGASLKVLPGIHNKTIILDRRVLIEGSFNWLSAVRDESSEYHRHETSLVVKSPYCERFIVRAEIELGLSAV